MRADDAPRISQILYIFGNGALLEVVNFDYESRHVAPNGGVGTLEDGQLVPFDVNLHYTRNPLVDVIEALEVDDDTRIRVLVAVWLNGATPVIVKTIFSFGEIYVHV